MWQNGKKSIRVNVRVYGGHNSVRRQTLTRHVLTVSFLTLTDSDRPGSRYRVGKEGSARFSYAIFQDHDVKKSPGYTGALWV